MNPTKTHIRKLAWVLPVLFLILIGDVQAQRTVFIPSSNATVGVLNDSIFGDTLMNGERVDTNTTYVLQKGGFYLLNGTIENRFPLKIVAADTGTGGRPIIQPAVDGGGGSSRPFTPRADLTLKGIYATNADNGGNLNTRIIRARADDMRIVLDDCHFDKDGQSGIRIDNDDMKIYITNTIFSNIGQTTDPNNGRVIDDRGNPIDTLWMENSTFYNITSTIIRDDGGLTNYMDFNHNTVVNTGQRVIEAGPITTMRMTNNLFVNPGFLGTHASVADDRQIIQIDSLGIDTSTMMPFPQNIHIRNNNFVLDTATIADFYPDSVTVSPLFNADAQSFFDSTGAAATTTEEWVMFDSMPGPLSMVITAFYDAAMTPPAMDDGGGGLLLQSPFNFIYNTSAASATGSGAGQPLGDLNWWDLDITSLQDDLLETSAKLFNYPNPFGQETTISYQLERSGKVQVKVYDMTGQQIAVVVDEQQSAGTHEVTWNGSVYPGGLYFYQLDVDGAITTGKMILSK